MSDKIDRQEWRWVALVTLALVIASSLPYLLAWVMRPEGTHFTGLLFNPLDGHSYIAKMRQGFDGSWLFRLPYTPELQDGAPVYLFYLSLGHVARWVGLPIILVYHVARLLGDVGMLMALYVLVSQLSESSGERRVMFLLTAMGSGLGWLVGAMGIRTADLWVSEAFPVYSLLVNAHFPLAIGLMIGIAVCGLRIMTKQSQGVAWLWGFGMVLSALMLGVIQPFGLPLVFGGLGVTLMVQAMRERSIPWLAVGWVGSSAVAALPYPLYTQWMIKSDPVLAAWSAQNATPSLPLWDWMLSYGLILALAALGGIVAARRGSSDYILLLSWLGTTLVGMYLPISLQRRLSLGLGVPIGLLAGMGWWRMVRGRTSFHIRSSLQGVVIAFSGLTPIFLIAITLLAALAGEPRYYLGDDEWRAMTWLRENVGHEHVVLCAPRTGMFVPAWAGQRVVYGHPFETVNAERREALVEAYWSGEMSAAEQDTFLQENRVGYLFVGPRERGLGAEEQRSGGTREQEGKGTEEQGVLVFETGDVRVYEVKW